MENKIELISASVSDRGLSEKRPQNEDSFVELPRFGVFAVADGVGGAQAGDFASQMAMELLTEAVSNQPDATDPEELFRVAIEHANRSIYQMAADVPQLSSMATTIVALHLRGNIATLAHVGDSRIYRFTPDGRAIRETNDHSVVEEEVRAGRMTPEEAAIHPSRNVISRALGAESTVEIDFKTIMVEPNTTFMLCSDGITRHIPDDELQAIFASGAQPELICNHLREVCYSRGAEDNLTAVVVRTFAEPAEEADDFDAVLPIDREDETVATARTAYAAITVDAIEITDSETFGDLDIGEVETGELPAPVERDAIEPETTSVDESWPSEHAEARQLFEVPSSEETYEQDLISEDDGAKVEPIAEVPRIVEPLGSDDTDEQFLLTEPEEEAGINEGGQDLASYTSSSVVVPARQSESESDFAIFGSQNAVSSTDNVSSNGGPNRILISIGLLALGALIAVGAVYLFGSRGQDETTAPPQVETMKTQNIPLTSFEETRRTVDKDPAAYASKTATPTDAADFYLMGRALLLSGKTIEAKRQLELAREQLAQVDESERKTISNEIALALAVVDNPAAIEAFKKSIGGNSAPANTASPIR